MPEEFTQERGMGAMDVLGLTPSAQVELAKWRIFHNPGIYANALQYGIRWPGTFLFGGFGAPGKMATSLGGYAAGRIGLGDAASSRVQTVTRAIGSVFGGGTMSKTGLQVGGMTAPGLIEDAQLRKIVAQRLESVGARRFAFGWNKRKAQVSNAVYEDIVKELGRRPTIGSPASARAVAGSTVSRSAVEAAVGGGAKRMLALRAFGTLAGAMNVVLGFQIASWMGQGAFRIGNHVVERLVDARRLDFGGPNSVVVRSRGAYTERQRALQEIQASNLNARRHIGNEAQMMHQ
jgi:hypothetical protein